MKKYNIEDMYVIAKSRGGRCLSKEYKGSLTKLIWVCKNNHKWNAIPGSIIRGHWCPICKYDNMILHRKGIYAKKNIKDMQILASKYNGFCLSLDYINSRTKMIWRCKDKHEWIATPNNIQRGHWCPICGRKNMINNRSGRCAIKSIEDMNNLAKKHNGLCLSNKYINMHTHLKWKCKNEHEWMAVPNIINKGQWCPECSSYKSENLCREYLNKITGFSFKKCNPEWLKKLQLDGYCKELNLAFEYNGIQHYKLTPYFHKKKKDYHNQIKRDQLKQKLCKENNVRLIKIPYKYNSTNPSKLYEYIDSQIQ
jgi:hypothetical protein